MKLRYFYLILPFLFLFCKEPVAKKFNHSRTFFPLTGAHLGVNCRECHKDGTMTSLPTACESCHPMTPAHTQNLGDCTLCHTTASFSAAFFNHSRAGVNIQGAHVSLVIQNCFNCHTPGTYKGISFACYRCHSPPSIDGRLHKTPTDDCSYCHNQAFFNPAGFPEHNTYPTKLLGAHASLNCSSCHASKTNWLGSVIYRDGTVYGSCANCHTRQYKGNSHHHGLPADANCGMCHGYGGFHGG